MQENLIELQIYYEIAMSVGNSLDLDDMLAEAIPSFIRKLNCAAGLVFRENPTCTADSNRYNLILSIPKNFQSNKAVLYGISKIISVPCQDEKLENINYFSDTTKSYFYHCFILKNFGLLLLIKHGSPLPKRVIKALSPLYRKLSASCMACEQNRLIRSMNRELDIENKLRIKAESDLRKSLHDKELLLKEIHHRVKNNLAIINSILHLKAESICNDELNAILSDIQNRIYSISLVHEHLYRESSLDHIELRKYLGILTEQIINTTAADPSSIINNIQIPGGYLNINNAIPLGLIMTELLINAIKYSLPYPKSGEINIALNKNSENKYILSIWNNGIGLPEGFSLKGVKSLGLRLVSALCAQIQSEIRVADHAHTKFEIILNPDTCQIFNKKFL